MKKSGFTIVELLTVIAIVAVLAATLLPALSRARESSKRAVCLNNLKQIGIAFMLYTDDYDDFFPCAQDPVNTSPVYWLWMGRGWRGILNPYLSRYPAGKTSRIFTCPSDKTAPRNWESTSYAYSMCFYHSPEQIDAMASPSDTYDPARIVPSLGQKSSKVLHPAKKILAGEWLDNHSGGANNWWSWAGARNYLFADGHAEYLPANRILPANDGWPDPNLTERGISGMDIQ
jgi:prepilin-type N-terminal cleavage/methylation domain-containing protein/prepilin-type processing-associated H-X9-DG protein